MAYKTELQSNNTDLQTILSKVNALPDQLVLPTLKNPAGAENIEAGFQALDGNGEIIEAGFQALDGNGEIIEGTASIGKTPVRIVSQATISWKGVVCAIDPSKTYFVTVKLDSQWHTCVIVGGVIIDSYPDSAFCTVTDGNLISSKWNNAKFIVYES